MSSAAAQVATLREENRGLAERLGAAQAKSGQLSEENRNLSKRLVAVEGQLAQRNRELAERNRELAAVSEEMRDLAERLAKVKVNELVCATVPELTVLSDGGQNAAVSSSSSSSSSANPVTSDTRQSTAASSSGSSAQAQHGEEQLATKPTNQHERAAVPVASGARQSVAASSSGSTADAQRGEGLANERAAPARKSPPIGLLFPEWDDNYGKRLSDVKDIPAVKDMLEKAKNILGVDGLKLCLEGPGTASTESSDLTTYMGDVIMYISGLAWLEQLRSDLGEVVTGAEVAGLGAGEYVALTAAGVFSFEDGLKLVRLCWFERLKAGKSTKQATALVIGLEKPRVAELCTTAAKKGGGAVCQISRELFSVGFWVGGTEKSVLVLKELAEMAGAWAQLLWIPFAVHTPLLRPAEERMRAAIDEVLPRMSPPRVTLYMNCTAAPMRPGTPPKDIADALMKELTSPVLWETLIKAMIESGISKFYEVGPGGSLKGFMRRINVKVFRSMKSIGPGSSTPH